ncbi:MAG: hypothetical protein IJP29_04820 [Lachnospiraceae bacterium]|nr:hypothetical protein [Lachnospiraceae bacterium]
MLALKRERTNQRANQVVQWAKLRKGKRANRKVLSLRTYKWKRKLGLCGRSRWAVQVGKVIFAVLILAGCAVAFTGCTPTVSMESDMQNVEQRDYATILLVSQGERDEDYKFSLGIAQEKKKGEGSQKEEVATFLADDLEELYEEYWKVKGKSLSLVHLKVVLISDRQVMSQENFWDFIEDLDENRDIAKTCPVVQIQDEESFVKYMENAKEPVGAYLENLVKINEKEGSPIPKVKDYLKVMREGSDLQEYYLEKTEEGFVLKSTIINL